LYWQALEIFKESQDTQR